MAHEKRSELGAKAAGSAGSEVGLIDGQLLDKRLEVPVGTEVHKMTAGYEEAAPPVLPQSADAELLGDHGINSHAAKSIGKPLTLAKGIDVHPDSSRGYEVE